MKDKLLPVSVVKDRLSVSTSQVYNLIKCGDLPAVKTGIKRGYRVKESTLEEFIGRNPVVIL